MCSLLVLWFFKRIRSFIILYMYLMPLYILIVLLPHDLGSSSNSSQLFLSYFPIFSFVFVAIFDPLSLSRTAWMGIGVDFR